MSVSRAAPSLSKQMTDFALYENTRVSTAAVWLRIYLSLMGEPYESSHG